MGQPDLRHRNNSNGHRHRHLAETLLLLLAIAAASTVEAKIASQRGGDRKYDGGGRGEVSVPEDDAFDQLGVPSSMALETEGASFDLQKPAPIVDVVPPIPRSEEDEQRRLRYNDPSGARSDSKDEEYYDDDDEYTMHVVPLNPPEGDPNANWQWCLLTLDGNATILQLRKEDFVRYLKMNLASLIGSDYDSVLFNSASYTPAILVNVTLNWHGRTQRVVSTLGELAKFNDTLFDLSGSHFNLTEFVPWSAIMAPKPIVPMENGVDPREVEALIYMSVGVAIAFLLTASMMFAVCQCIAKPKNRRSASGSGAAGETFSDKQLRRTSESTGALFASQYSLEEYVGVGPSQTRNENDVGDEATSGQQRPKMIYSQSYADGLSQHQHNTEPYHHHRRHHRRSLCCRNGHFVGVGGGDDGGFAPLATFDEMYNNGGGCFSDGDEDPHRRMSHNNCPVSDSQSDIVTASLLDNGGGGEPFRRPFSVQSDHRHHRHHPHSSRHSVRRSRGGCLPMEPVFPSAVAFEGAQPRPGRPGSLSPQPPPSPAVRPISPMYDRSRPLSEILMETPTGFGDEDGEGDDDVDFGGFGNGRLLSSFKPAVAVPPPPPPKPTQAEIDRDVQIILRNMGLDAPTPPNMTKQVFSPTMNGRVNGGAEIANGHVTTTTAIVEQHPRGPVLQTGL